MLAVRDDVAQFVYSSSTRFFGHQRRTAEVSPLGGFPVALRAILLEDRVRRQRRIGCRRLCEEARSSE